jgi:hypothetical protein
VVSVFHEHPDRFSISVHGDNHDHQEFGPFSDKPVAGQIIDIKQALARMAAFQKLTGLTYDPVMVFPHKISPQATLAYLKRYNFWATFNGDNVPLDAVPPTDPNFALRPATLAFAHFPSVHRYSTEYPIPDWVLAMDAFLGNPMLFYCHESYFATGIGAFDHLADGVNHLAPDTEWRGLGYIAQHLYLERLRDDGNYDLELFSSSVSIKNSSGHDALFFVEKEEDGAVPFKVMVDGQAQTYHLVGGWLRARIPVPAGATREVAFSYENDFDLAGTDISKPSLRINAIRYLSDFRDCTVSKTALGRRFIRSYFVHRNAWNIGAVTGLVILVIACWYLRNSKRTMASLTQ